jgi:hypothetical protein
VADRDALGLGPCVPQPECRPLQNGKQLHPAVKLPAAVLTPPGVSNSGTYIELNPRECEPGSLATGVPVAAGG